MPYKTNSDLPPRVREAMPAKAQSIFRNVFNSVIAQEGETDATAFAQAYGAVENAGYHKNTEGDWVKKSEEWRREFEIIGKQDEQQVVYGWLSVAFDKAGNQIVDADNDIIEIDDLEKAAIDFALNSRKAGENHERVEGVGRMVASLVTSPQIQKVMGIPEGYVPQGWLIGFKVDDPDVWDKVKKGIYSGFSVGGHGRREIIEE